MVDKALLGKAHTACRMEIQGPETKLRHATVTRDHIDIDEAWGDSISE